MRPHIHARAQQKLSRTHLIKKDEWSHHLSLLGRQGPPHSETPEVPCARHDDNVDRIASELVTGLGIVSWLPAHLASVWNGSRVQQVQPTPAVARRKPSYLGQLLLSAAKGDMPLTGYELLPAQLKFSPE